MAADGLYKIKLSQSCGSEWFLGAAQYNTQIGG